MIIFWGEISLSQEEVMKIKTTMKKKMKMMKMSMMVMKKVSDDDGYRVMKTVL